jgi:hypothetical protein
MGTTMEMNEGDILATCINQYQKEEEDDHVTVMENIALLHDSKNS